MSFQLSPAQVEALLYELCVVLGFCLPPDEQARLRESPPTDVDAFADAVIRAEELDSDENIPIHLRRDMRSRVAEHFRKAEDNFSSA